MGDLPWTPSSINDIVDTGVKDNLSFQESATDSVSGNVSQHIIHRILPFHVSQQPRSKLATSP